MRYRPRLDQNQQAIVEAYRNAGLLVLSLAGMGKGVPDLLVCAPPLVVLVEVKMPQHLLTPDQVRFHAHWPVVIVTSVEEAHAHARVLTHLLPHLPATFSALSGYAEILLEPVFSEKPLPRVLQAHGRKRRGKILAEQAAAAAQLAGAIRGTSDPFSGIS